jgi:hypothetical protein
MADTELTFELPADVKEALDAARDKVRGYTEQARAEFDAADGDESDDADEITSWFDELEELADNIDSVPEEPDTD